ncbi:MAG: S41 family peptidase, partial [Proteobacteria bacterium]|nr:S41 family peptidase [Pseudomonadota bacterium]
MNQFITGTGYLPVFLFITLSFLVGCHDSGRVLVEDAKPSDAESSSENTKESSQQDSTTNESKTQDIQDTETTKTKTLESGVDNDQREDTLVDDTVVLNYEAPPETSLLADVNKAIPVDLRFCNFIGAAFSDATVIGAINRHYYYHENGITDVNTFTHNAIVKFIAYQDPNKIFLTSADVYYMTLQFDGYDLPTMIKNNDCSKLYKVSDYVSQKIVSGYKQLKKMLLDDIDMTQEEYYDQKTVAYSFEVWPSNEDELQERRRKYIKKRMLDYISVDAFKELEMDSYEAKFELVRWILFKRFDESSSRVLNQTKSDAHFNFSKALFYTLDINTTIFDKSGSQRFLQSLNEDFIGIGIRFLYNPFVDRFYVVDVIENGPADRGGLKKDDRLVAIRSRGATEWQYFDGLSSGEVSTLVLGADQTQIDLLIHRPSAKLDYAYNELILSLTRGRVELKLAENLIPHALFDIQLELGGEPIKVGVVKSDSFWTDKVFMFLDRLILMQQAGADVIVFDLRDNGGGILDSAVDLINVFIDTEIAVVQRDIRGLELTTKVLSSEKLIHPNRHKDLKGFLEIPVVLLVSSKSASASEVVAGSLKTHGRVLVIGQDRTYGKGTIQKTNGRKVRVGDGDEGVHLSVFKVTSGKYYLPDGSSVQTTGISSDIVLPSYDDVFKLPSESLVNSNTLFTNDSIVGKYRLLNLGFRDQAIIDRLNEFYLARVTSDEWLKENGQWFEELNLYDHNNFPLWLKAHSDSEIERKIDAKSEAHKEFKKIENKGNTAVTNNLFNNDHTLKDTLYLAAEYYRLCRLEGVNASMAADSEYDKSLGCLGSEAVLEAMTEAAETVDEEQDSQDDSKSQSEAIDQGSAEEVQIDEQDTGSDSEETLDQGSAEEVQTDEQDTGSGSEETLDQGSAEEVQTDEQDAGS